MFLNLPRNRFRALLHGLLKRKKKICLLLNIFGQVSNFDLLPRYVTQYVGLDIYRGQIFYTFPNSTMILRTSYTLAHPRTCDQAPLTFFPPSTVRYLRAPPPTQDINSSLTQTQQSGQCVHNFYPIILLYSVSRKQKLQEGVVRCCTNYQLYIYYMNNKS